MSLSTTSGLSNDFNFGGRKKYDPNDVMTDINEIKRNFRGLRMFNKRHLPEHKKLLFSRKGRNNPEFDKYRHTYGLRKVGVTHAHGWERVPETEPMLIVPDLEGCQLKPYVSYTTKEVFQVST